jgi:hypothetical protein
MILSAPRRWPFAAALLAASLATTPALAVTDAAGDFLVTHAGPANPDLDIREALVFDLGLVVAFGSRFAGELGATPGASYVWGIDRGAGTAGLFTGTPPVGPGVTFDAVVVLSADGLGGFGGNVIAFNAGAPPTVTSLSDSVFAFGDVLTALVPADLLPSRGFAQADYRFNLWTRSAGDNIGIADLALGAGTFGAVPEPSTWGMLIIGLGLAGIASRRRRWQEQVA